MTPDQRTTPVPETEREVSKITFPESSVFSVNDMVLRYIGTRQKNASGKRIRYPTLQIAYSGNETLTLTREDKIKTFPPIPSEIEGYRVLGLNIVRGKVNFEVGSYRASGQLFNAPNGIELALEIDSSVPLEIKPQGDIDIQDLVTEFAHIRRTGES